MQVPAAINALRACTKADYQKKKIKERKELKDIVIWL